MPRSTLFVTISVICLAGIGACASSGSQVRVDKADTDLTKCRTFDWLAVSKEATSLTDQRMRAAALAELERKGYTASTDNPDCHITYALSSYERPEEKPRVGVGVGGGSGGMGGGIGVSLPVGRRDARAGTITIDVVDVAKKAQIWSGSLDATFQSEELSEREAQELMTTILHQYPDKPK
jgi:hypothetical protein